MLKRSTCDRVALNEDSQRKYKAARLTEIIWPSSSRASGHESIQQLLQLCSLVKSVL
jgi:hypothetical protein